MSELIRPTKCSICKEQMYYSDNPKYEPEVLIRIELPKWQEAVEIKNMSSRIASLFGVEKLYAHVRCWNNLPITLHDSNL